MEDEGRQQDIIAVRRMLLSVKHSRSLIKLPTKINKIEGGNNNVNVREECIKTSKSDS